MFTDFFFDDNGVGGGAVRRDPFVHAGQRAATLGHSGARLAEREDATEMDGRDSPNMPWPPHSSDLTLCDYFMCGFVKSKLYGMQPASILELKERIRGTFAEITIKMRQNAVLVYHERLEQVIENEGVMSKCTTDCLYLSENFVNIILFLCLQCVKVWSKSVEN